MACRRGAEARVPAAAPPPPLAAAAATAGEAGGLDACALPPSGRQSAAVHSEHSGMLCSMCKLPILPSVVCPPCGLSRPPPSLPSRPICAALGGPRREPYTRVQQTAAQLGYRRLPLQHRRSGLVVTGAQSPSAPGGGSLDGPALRAYLLELSAFGTASEEAFQAMLLEQLQYKLNAQLGMQEPQSSMEAHDSMSRMFKQAADTLGDSDSKEAFLCLMLLLLLLLLWQLEVRHLECELAAVKLEAVRADARAAEAAGAAKLAAIGADARAAEAAGAAKLEAAAADARAAEAAAAAKLADIKRAAAERELRAARKLIKQQDARIVQLEAQARRAQE